MASGGTLTSRKQSAEMLINGLVQAHAVREEKLWAREEKLRQDGRGGS